MVVTTGPFPGAPARRTLVIDAATTYYFHKEGDGVLTGMGGRDERPSFSTSVDHRFIEEELLPTAIRVFPPIEHAGLARMWAGLYEMTPDRHPIIGESPVRGLFLANGFSGHGFQHAPSSASSSRSSSSRGRHAPSTSPRWGSIGSNAATSSWKDVSCECRERGSNPHGPKPTGF